MKENEASSTALTVAQGLLHIAGSGHFPGLVSEGQKEACEAILSSCEDGKKRLRQLNNPVTLAGLKLMERLLLPGASLHYALRKRYIEDETHKSIREGFGQVINLGAGLDTLAYRMAPAHGGIQWLEVDHPNTIGLKHAFYEQHKIEGGNLSLLGVDFSREDLFARLQDFPSMHSDRPTLFILEGVTMYLSEEEVRSLFLSLRKIVHSRVKVIFTFLDPSVRSDYSRGPLLGLYLRLKGEPLFWKIDNRHLGDFLSPLGFRLTENVGAESLRTLYLPADNRTKSHEGEGIAVVESIES